uniref:ANIS5_cation-bd domain-containing protein n=1 Tax=Panagrellus redivivus TaxID=6233 RepID=A0A7E4VCG7_PANRE
MIGFNLQLFVLVIVTTCVLAGPFGGRRYGHSAFGNVTFPRPTFLNGLSRSEFRAFNDIVRNQSLSRNQINSSLQAWASIQTSEVQSEFNDYQADLTSAINQVIAQTDAIAANLSSDAQSLYNAIKEIQTNNSLTGLEQRSEVQNVLDDATFSVVRELFSAIPFIAGLPGHRGGFGFGRHGFGGGRGGFGGFGGGFGFNRGGFGGFF